MKNKIQVRRYQEGDAKFLSQIYYNTIHTVNTNDYTQEQLDAWAPASGVAALSSALIKRIFLKPQHITAIECIRISGGLGYLNHKLECID